MGLLRTIVIIMLVYYLFKIVARYVFPFFIKRFMGKMEEKMRNQTGGFDNKQEDINIGETVIDKKPQNKSSNNDVGEYVDYEEIE